MLLGDGEAHAVVRDEMRADVAGGGGEDALRGLADSRRLLDRAVDVGAGDPPATARALDMLGVEIVLEDRALDRGGEPGLPRLRSAWACRRLFLLFG